MANYITNEEFLSLLATLKDKDAVITSLMEQCKSYSETCAKHDKLRKAAKNLIEYGKQGEHPLNDWDKYYDELGKAISSLQF